jgi:small conductance mechanosensitive channel
LGPHPEIRRILVRLLIPLFVSLVVLFMPNSILQAQQDERVTVRVDGRSLIRVGPTEELSARERADQIERRMANLLENPQSIAPAQIEVSQSNQDQRVISVAGVPVVTVTEADAQDNLITVDALAIQWTQAIDWALQRGADRRLAPGGRFVAEVRAAVEAAFGSLIESAVTIIPRVLAALLVIGLFWLLAATVRYLMRLLFRRIVSDLTVENLIKQVAYYSIWTLGIIVAVDAFGFDPEVVLTSLGLTSLALGFALRDILSNYVSGILILTMRPFEIGDQIVVGDTEGTVERINLRATQIRTYDGRIILVPNAELFTSRVTNNTSAPVRRASVNLFLGYEVDLRQVSEVLMAAMQATEGVLTDPTPSIRIRELNRDDIQVEARFWTDSRRSDYLLTSSAVRVSLLDALKQAGIPMPDPTARVVRIE